MGRKKSTKRAKQQQQQQQKQQPHKKENKHPKHNKHNPKQKQKQPPSKIWYWMDRVVRPYIQLPHQLQVATPSNMRKKKRRRPEDAEVETEVKAAEQPLPLSDIPDPHVTLRITRSELRDSPFSKFASGNSGNLMEIEDSKLEDSSTSPEPLIVEEEDQQQESKQIKNNSDQTGQTLDKVVSQAKIVEPESTTKEQFDTTPDDTEETYAEHNTENNSEGTKYNQHDGHANKDQSTIDDTEQTPAEPNIQNVNASTNDDRKDNISNDNQDNHAKMDQATTDVNEETNAELNPAKTNKSTKDEKIDNSSNDNHDNLDKDNHKKLEPSTSAPSHAPSWKTLLSSLPTAKPPPSALMSKTIPSPVKKKKQKNLQGAASFCVASMDHPTGATPCDKNITPARKLPPPFFRTILLRRDLGDQGKQVKHNSAASDEKEELVVKICVSPGARHIAKKKKPKLKLPFGYLPRGDCGDGIPNPFPPHKVQDKYWAQRRRFFSRFDQGVQLDREGWFSVTPEVIARHVAQKVVKLLEMQRDNDAAAPVQAADIAMKEEDATSTTKEQKKEEAVGVKNQGEGWIVLDAFCGCGGNAIAFATQAKISKIICVDTDENKLRMLAHNAAVYDVDPKKLLLIHANALSVLQLCAQREPSSAPKNDKSTAVRKMHKVHLRDGRCASYVMGGMDLLPSQVDVVFLSPPWGGTEYCRSGRESLDPAVGNNTTDDDYDLASIQVSYAPSERGCDSEESKEIICLNGEARNSSEVIGEVDSGQQDSNEDKGEIPVVAKEELAHPVEADQQDPNEVREETPAMAKEVLANPTKCETTQSLHQFSARKPLPSHRTEACSSEAGVQSCDGIILLKLAMDASKKGRVVYFLPRNVDGMSVARASAAVASASAAGRLRSCVSSDRSGIQHQVMEHEGKANSTPFSSSALDTVTSEFASTAAHSEVELEANILNDKLKTTTAYFGFCDALAPSKEENG